MTPEELLATTLDLLADTNRRLGASRQLAAALLVRQALEDALEAFWQRTMPGLEGTSGRAQLITLPFYLDATVAGRVAYAWYRLSGWCHHDAYELPPHADELKSVAEIVGDLIQASTRA